MRQHCAIETAGILGGVRVREGEGGAICLQIDPGRKIGGSLDNKRATRDTLASETELARQGVRHHQLHWTRTQSEKGLRRPAEETLPWTRSADYISVGASDDSSGLENKVASPGEREAVAGTLREEDRRDI